MASQASPSIAWMRLPARGSAKEVRAASGRSGQHEAQRPVSGKNFGCAHQFRQMAEGFAATAAWEHCYQWTTRARLCFRKKSSRERAGRTRVASGCPMYATGTSCCAEKRLFERKDTKQPVDDPPHRFHAALCATPRPAARRDRPPGSRAASACGPRGNGNPGNRSGSQDRGFSRAAARISSRNRRQMRGRWPTTSTIPTTDKSSDRITGRTPASRRCGPAQPKNSHAGQRRRSSRTSSAA